MAAFVGRSAELALLDASFEDAAGGRLQIVAIEGDSGIGKTRLIEEFRNRIAHNVGVRVCIGHCLEYVRAPYLPFTEVFSALGFSLPVQDQQGPAERDADAKLQYFKAVADALLKHSEKRTLVIVIEDAHWADDVSLELLQYLALRLRESRILLLLTQRSDSPQAASVTGSLLMRMVRAGAKHIHLRALGHDEVWALAASLARQKQLSAQFLSDMEAVADGNPLFIEELVRSAADGAATGSRPLEVPLTIKATLSERMLSLDDRERDVLLQAAVIGKKFDLDFLCELCAWPREQVLAALQRARDLQLIVQDAERAPRYAFRHALLRETLYQGILAELAGPLHARVAARMESNPQTANELAELAYHWTAAGIEDKAIEYNERAGDAAAAVFAYSDAVRFYRCAVAFPYPAGPRRAHLYERLALALRSAEGGEECEEWLNRAYSDYHRLGDVESMVRVLLHLAMQRWLDCNTEGSVECTSQAIDLLHGRAHQQLLLKARLYKAAFCSTLGRVEEARDELAAIEAMAVARDDEANALLHEVKAEIDAALDFGDEAFENLRRAAEFAERSQNSDMASFVENMFVITSSLVGGVSAAHAHFERAIEAARKDGLGWREAHACVHYADVLLFSGELLQAREVLGRGLAIPVASSTIRACATFAGIPLAGMLEDDALVEYLSDQRLIEGTFRSQEPQRIALMAAAFADLFAGRGDLLQARALLRRALHAIKRFHFSWRLAIQVALLGEARDVETLRALSETAPPARQPLSQAYERFMTAVITSRFESVEGAIPLALDAAQRFSYIGCRLYEPRALEVAQRPHDALVIYEEIGSRRDVRRLRAALHPEPRHDASGMDRLTARQRQVATLLTQGASNREISERLGISENTVEHHVSDILSRLGVATRGQLVARLLSAPAHT